MRQILFQGEIHGEYWKIHQDSQVHLPLAVMSSDEFHFTYVECEVMIEHTVVIWNQRCAIEFLESGKSDRRVGVEE